VAAASAMTAAEQRDATALRSTSLDILISCRGGWEGCCMNDFELVARKKIGYGMGA
jgi:hypothetical protein